MKIIETKLGHMNFHKSREKFIPGKHARDLNLKQQQRKENLRKNMKPKIFEHTQVEPKKYDFIKTNFKSHLKQQLTTLALATTMKVV